MSHKSVNKTVYFLGAGASAASGFGLPVMQRFFCEKHLPSKDFPNLKSFIQKVKPYSDIEKVNVEDIMTHLDLSLGDFGGKWQQDRTLEQKARQELYTYITKRLSRFRNDQGPSEPHLELARTLKDPDSVLTLNYDLVMDFALFKNEPTSAAQRRNFIYERSCGLLDMSLVFSAGRPTLDHEDVGKGMYIKLHGSLQWLSCPNSLCAHHQLIFPNEFSFKPRFDVGDPCSGCGNRLDLVIVPPTMRKTLERFPKLGYLWSLGFRELKATHRLVFWGVSLAQQDYLLRWLIREAMMSRKKTCELFLINLESEEERLKKELGQLTNTERDKIGWYLDMRQFLKEQT